MISCPVSIFRELDRRDLSERAEGYPAVGCDTRRGNTVNLKHDLGKVREPYTSLS